MRSFCSGQLPTKHGAAKHVGSEGHESKAGRGWWRKKPSAEAQVVINGEEADDKGPSSRCQPYNYKHFISRRKDFVYNIKHSHSPIEHKWRYFRTFDFYTRKQHWKKNL